MILPWGDHFGKRTVWSLIYFLNYAYFYTSPSLIYGTPSTIYYELFTIWSIFFILSGPEEFPKHKALKKCLIDMQLRKGFGRIVRYVLTCEMLGTLTVLRMKGLLLFAVPCMDWPPIGSKCLVLALINSLTATDWRNLKRHSIKVY